MEIEERISKLEERVGDKATRISIANIPLTVGDKEYHYQFPKNLKGFRLSCQDGTTFKLAFTPGHVGTAAPSPPYHTVVTNGHLDIRNLNIEELHLYVAGTIAKVIEIIAWSKGGENERD